MIAYNVYDDVTNLRNLVDAFFSHNEYQAISREFPLVNISSTDEEIELEALVPGMSAEDITLNLVDNHLVIEGEKKEDYADERYIRRERHFGNFKRSIRLPYRVDNDTIEASMKNGILRVKLVKNEDAKPKKIEIR